MASLIEESFRYPILHVPMLIPLLHWFQYSFCFRSRTFPSHAGNFFWLQWELQCLGSMFHLAVMSKKLREFPCPRTHSGPSENSLDFFTSKRNVILAIHAFDIQTLWLDLSRFSWLSSKWMEKVPILNHFPVCGSWLEWEHWILKGWSAEMRILAISLLAKKYLISGDVLSPASRGPAWSDNNIWRPFYRVKHRRA